MTAVVTAVFLALAGFAVVSVGWIIPNSHTSRFRYRLWRLRDNLYDELRRDEFENDAPARAFLRFVEDTIVYSPEFTPLRLFVMHLSYGRGLHRSVPMPAFLKLESLSDGDRERLTAHLEEFERAATRQITLGSPSGWLATLFLVPVAALAAAWDVLSGRGSSVIDGAKLKVRDELRDEIIVPASLGGTVSRASLQHSM